MPNRQTWTLCFWVTLPSGKKDVFRATAKLYFEDEEKSLAYFDADTLDWWTDGDANNEEDWDFWVNYRDTVSKTLDYYTVLPKHVKAKTYRSQEGWNGFTAHRNSRN